MTRVLFDRDLSDIQAQVIALGSEVEEHILKAVVALERRDLIDARRLIAVDSDINEKQINIMQKCYQMIATQQPMAGDMRFLAAAISIVSELERIHDYIKGISKSSLSLGSEPVGLPEYTDKLKEMAKTTQEMLRLSLDAFTQHNADLARTVPAMDDRVDALFLDAYRIIVTYAMQNATQIERANQMEWATHNLERAADRTINICEWVVYMVDGVYQEMDSEFEAPPTR